jgi:hypothetical protein
MPSAQEVVDKARQLIEQARNSEKCLTQAKAAEDGIKQLKESTKFTTADVVGFAGAAISFLGGIGSGGSLGGIAAIGSGFSALGVGWRVVERVKKAKDDLAKTNQTLEDCLSQP